MPTRPRALDPKTEYRPRAAEQASFRLVLMRVSSVTLRSPYPNKTAVTTSSGGPASPGRAGRWYAIDPGPETSRGTAAANTAATRPCPQSLVRSRRRSFSLYSSLPAHVDARNAHRIGHLCDVHQEHEARRVLRPVRGRNPARCLAADCVSAHERSRQLNLPPMYRLNSTPENAALLSEQSLV